MLVSAAANDKVENLPLARRQCRDMSANDVQLALQATRHFMMRNRSRNCPKKIVRRYGLGQKIIRTRLDGPYRGRNIEVTTEEYDRQQPSSLSRDWSSGPLTPGIRTSRTIQLETLSLGKRSSKCWAEA